MIRLQFDNIFSSKLCYTTSEMEKPSRPPPIFNAKAKALIVGRRWAFSFVLKISLRTAQCM